MLAFLHHMPPAARSLNHLWFLVKSSFCAPAALLFLCSGHLNAAEKQAKTAKADAQAPITPLLEIDPHEGHARALFRKKNFRAALLALEGKSLSLDGHLIAAESLYRLHKLAEARTHFQDVIKESHDTSQKRKTAMRLFDIEIATGDLKASIAHYVSFEKEYGNPSARMRYGLGKMLYDAQHFEHARKVLGGIKKGNEFFGRARYIIATMGLKADAKKAAKVFNQIEKLEPVSTEDYAVRQLAILAQGRIFVDIGREDLAAKAYERVTLADPFGQVAVEELVRAMVNRATLAQLGEGRFKKASLFKRGLIEREALEAAQKAVARYQKAHDIDWRKPKLLAMTASLMTEARRYDDARRLLDELSDHFKPIHSALLEQDKQEALWSGLRMSFYTPHSPSLVSGVPNSMVQDLLDVPEILHMRDRIERGHHELFDLQQRAVYLGMGAMDSLTRVQKNQSALEDAYAKMIQKKQVKLSNKLAEVINQNLVEAEFLRAWLVQREMADLQKQMNAAQQFQNEKIELFEQNLKEIDKGRVP